MKDREIEEWKSKNKLVAQRKKKRERKKKKGVKDWNKAEKENKWEGKGQKKKIK